LSFGIASDLLKPFAGADSVRWVLMGAGVLYLVPGYFYLRAGRFAQQELPNLKIASLNSPAVRV
jgi:hypothetical protein